MTPPLPELWGQKEVQDHVDILCDRAGRPRFERGDPWVLAEVPDFPSPALILAMGSLYYGGQMRVWLAEYVERTLPRATEGLDA